MNEFITIQLGLVLGLTKLHKDTCAKARPTLEGVFGVERIVQITRDIDQHIDAITKIATTQKIEKMVDKTSTDTFHKLLVIRDLFIGEKWGDAQPIGEWSGFFEGLAMTRWAVISGASEALVSAEQSLVHNDLFLLATQAAEFHYAILHDGMKYFHHSGVTKAAE